MPPQYKGCQTVLLDIDPDVGADLVMDARELGTLEAAQYDGVYCSHNLEHYHEHEVDRVLRGMHHVTTADGFVDARVPDALAVMRRVIEEELYLDSTLYISPAGPIRACDTLWGWQREIERSGEPWFAHKWGFSERTLWLAFQRAGFRHVLIDAGNYEIKALAFKHEPARGLLDQLGVTYEG